MYTALLKTFHPIMTITPLLLWMIKVRLTETTRIISAHGAAIKDLRIGNDLFTAQHLFEPTLHRLPQSDTLTAHIPLSENDVLRLALKPVGKELISHHLPWIERGSNGSRFLIQSNTARNHLLPSHDLNESAAGLQNSYPQTNTKDLDCHYQHISSDIVASLSNCGRGLEGIVIRKNDLYLIRPFTDDLAVPDLPNDEYISGQPKKHLIYKRDAENDPSTAPHSKPKQTEQTFCGNDPGVSEASDEDPDTSSNQEDPQDVPTARASKWNGDLTAEVAVFVDAKLWNLYQTKHGGHARWELRSFIGAVFNNIQILFHHRSLQKKIKFKIVRMEIFESQPYELRTQAHNNGHAQNYLDLFCAYQRRLERNWDNAFLMTGYNLHRGSNSAISGIAKLSGMCSNWGSCMVAEGLDFVSAFIGAHEIGHTLGMQHDENKGCGSEFVMSGSLGPGKVTWSTCSVYALQAFIDRLDRKRYNCLRKQSYREDLALDISTLPGQTFDGDKQCSMMHGHGYTKVDRGGDSVCQMMWCRQSGYGRLITSHPALEGTHCGDGKWCMSGRCVTWGRRVKVEPARAQVSRIDKYRYRQRPAAVNGAWSAWSHSDSCSRCPSCASVKGGLPVYLSKRTCSNPAPANGGAKCAGEKYRAYICPSRSRCSLETLQSFLDRTCVNHRNWKADWTLTGKGSQLKTRKDRACKVFCNVQQTYERRSSYRTFGDNVPDGTSCGYRKYCVQGVCMNQNCDLSMITQDAYNCPTDSCLESSPGYPKPRANNNKGEWSDWSDWSGCSVTCGSGNRVRTRACYDWRPCQGDEEEKEVCYKSHCPKLSHWTAWSSWATCSVTCGTGTTLRYRTCRGGNDCSGERRDHKNCAEGFCPWTTWSACSRTCGMGTKRRSRKCPGGGCSGDYYDQTDCNVRSCVAYTVLSGSYDFGSWGSWSDCSRTCGTGYRYRSRRCRYGSCPYEKLRSKEECNTHRCTQSRQYHPRNSFRDQSNPSTGIWSLWSSWSSCDKTCGNAVRIRSRWCDGSYCGGRHKETTPCSHVPECPVWSSWSTWSYCSLTCGDGQQTRSRTCSQYGSCYGHPDDRRTCNLTPCSLYSTTSEYVWGRWSECSVSCGGTGVKVRVGRCSTSFCSAATSESRESCYEGACPYWNRRRRQAMDAIQTQR